MTASGRELYGGKEKVQVCLLEALGKRSGVRGCLPTAVAFHERPGGHTIFFFLIVLSWKQKQKLGKLQLFWASCWSHYGLLPWLLIAEVVGQSPTIMHDLAVVPVYVLSLLPKDFWVLFCFLLLFY